MNDRKNIIMIVEEALFGTRWQSDLAREIKVAVRTVQRWAAGDVEVPPGAWRDIHQLLIRRRRELDDAEGYLNARLVSGAR